MDRKNTEDKKTSCDATRTFTKEGKKMSFHVFPKLDNDSDHHTCLPLAAPVFLGHEHFSAHPETSTGITLGSSSTSMAQI